MSESELKDSMYQKLSLYSNELEDRIEDLEKLNTTITMENERLNNIINELEKWLKEEQVNSVDLDEWTIIQVRDKIEELKGSDKE